MSFDYGDGGAFAEMGYVQYPLNMGRQPPPAAVLRAMERLRHQLKPSSVSTFAATHTRDGLPVSLAVTTSSSYSTSSLSTAAGAFKASESPATSGATTSRALTLATSDRTAAVSTAAAAAASVAEETTARTAEALTQAVQAKTSSSSATANIDFSGKAPLQSNRRSASSATALTIVVPCGDGGVADPGPIVRSPTKEKKKSGSAGELPTSRKEVVVPFCVSSWHNTKKLVIPVEQRLAQQQDDRVDSEGGIGANVMGLALAMQKASKEVSEEINAREKARVEEEERKQAAVEAEEAERAKKLLEQNAARLAAANQRSETREERLARVKLERELRERERLEKQRQRLREKAAARLNITVEALEADEQLLRTVEETAASTPAGTGSGMQVPASSASSAVQPMGSGRSGAGASLISDRPANIFGDGVEGGEGDDDGGTASTTGAASHRVRGGVFASAVISNAGIAQEMEALAQTEQANAAHIAGDGIRLPMERVKEEVDVEGEGGVKRRRPHGVDGSNDGGDSDDDDDGDDEAEGFSMDALLKKRRRLV